MICLKMNLVKNNPPFQNFKISKLNISNSSEKTSNSILEDRELSQLKRYFDQLKKAEENKRKNGIGAKISLSSNLYELYKATSPSQVYNVLKIAQGQISVMTSLGASDKEIAAAKNVLRKLKNKAELKIANLKKEQRLQELREMEIRAKHREQAENLTKELIQKRKARRAKEKNDVIAAAQEESKKNNNSVNQGITIDISEAIPIADSSETIISKPISESAPPENVEGPTIDISL